MATTTGSTGTQKQIDRMADSAHGAIDRATQTASDVAEQPADHLAQAGRPARLQRVHASRVNA